MEYEQDIPLEVSGESLSLAWAGGLNSGQYFNLDIDRDGQQDLIVFDRISGQFSPFLSQQASFTYAPEYSLLFPEEISNWVYFADYDGDGLADLFTASGKRSITVYRNVSVDQLAWEKVADPIPTLGFSGFQVAIQVNASDMPGISDIDGDGDLDIVVYNINGQGNLEYYRNQSQELYGNSGQLEFVAEEREWGDVLECDCELFAFGNDNCSDVGAKKKPRPTKLTHIGAKSLLPIDVDGDGDKDLLTSDEGCGLLYFLENTGSTQQANFESFTTSYPNGLASDSSLAFPAAYYADATHDGVPDLIIAPNFSAESQVSFDMTATSWLYTNKGTAEQPVFVFDQKDFLQDAMLEVGSSATPALADYDADGDFDLFVGQRGVAIDSSYSAGVALYENVGSSGNPAFTFITDDYLEIRQLGLKRLNLYFEDINGDGLTDIVLSGAEQVFSPGASFFYLPNLAASGSIPWDFDLGNRQSLDLDFHPNDRLAFFDADADNDLDVLVGQQEGNLAYYENLGSSDTNPDWVLVREEAGGISSSIFRRNLSILLYDLDRNGQLDLISTDGSGYVSLRPDFVTQLTASEVPADTARVFFKSRARNIQVGNRSWLAAARLENSTNSTIFLGSPQGGIRLLNYNSESEVNAIGLLLFPNPITSSHQVLRVQSTESMAYLQVISASGSLVFEQEVDQGTDRLSINVAGMAAGIYLVRVWQESGKASVAKFVIQ